MPPRMNAHAITAGVAYRTVLTNFEKKNPATSAGRNASRIIAAKRRASGSDGRPRTTAAILAR